MPSLTMINILGHLVFTGKGLKLPTDAGWEQPSSAAGVEHYALYSLELSDLICQPTVVPPFFFPQNPHKYHQDSCNDVGEQFKNFHDTAINAVGTAVDMWRLSAGFKDLQIMALSAIGSPGCLDGQELESLIKTPMSSMTGNEGKYRDAVASGVSKCFKDWQDQVMVPGLPWYPAFVAFPGPQAPPMPNVPVPLIACPSSNMSKITVADELKNAMIDALDGGLKGDDEDKQHEVLFESIATVLSLGFLLWLVSQQVMLVMGKGPIPTFAPPYVPVGPVVGGSNLPGVHFLT